MRESTSVIKIAVTLIIVLVAVATAAIVVTSIQKPLLTLVNNADIQEETYITGTEISGRQAVTLAVKLDTRGVEVYVNGTTFSSAPPMLYDDIYIVEDSTRSDNKMNFQKK